MKKIFAIPTIRGKLCAHFGHSEKFALVETEDHKITGTAFITPPVHQPGTYPRFLAAKGVSTIIAGGMGQKARDIFDQHQIEVYMGVGSEEPEILVEQYLDSQLESGVNTCDH
ncbi:MAG: NifB/NifX family molybdenum-iron cluster-binding protein [bacterium]|jgi:predicted Fe-Mo cluster-binding NifX family protein